MDCHLPVTIRPEPQRPSRVSPASRLFYAVFMCILFGSRLILADEREAPVPGPNDRQITLAVKSYLEREHFLRKPIDDEIASRWFDTFLAALDPLKISFYETTHPISGAPARAALSSSPSHACPLNSTQWSTSFCLRFGMEIPALHDHVGMPIGEGR